MSTNVVLYGLKTISLRDFTDDLMVDIVTPTPMVVDYTYIGMSAAKRDLRDMADSHPEVLREIPTEVVGFAQLLVLDNKAMMDLVEQHQRMEHREADLYELLTEMKSNPELVWWIHIEY